MNALQNINDKINKLFLDGDNFSLVRVGNTEGYFLNSYFNNTTPVKEYYDWLAIVAGVYPVADSFLKTEWYRRNEEAIKNSDILGFVDISEEIKNDAKFLSQFCGRKKEFFFKNEIEVLDPVFLLGGEKIDDLWTKNLKGKKVLVVSSHEKTIKSQYNNMKKIWGENLDDIAGFDLVGVIKPPFHPATDDRQFNGCNSWDLTLDYLYNIISEYEYDVLLVGAGAYSPCIADFAKKSGKIGITLCGAIQIYFGILGTRWVDGSDFQNWKSLANESWVFPFEEDLPQHKERFHSFEKSYW